MLHSKGVVFSLDGGSTFFITTEPININDISIDPSGDGLLCQSENEFPTPGSRHWYINPEMESTATEDRILYDDDRRWVRTRVTLSNNIQQVIMRRQSASGSVEGIFTCQIGNDINPIRSLYVLYPSELYYYLPLITNTTKYKSYYSAVCHRDIIRLSDYVGKAALTQASRTEYILKASKLLHVSHCTTGALF